MAAAMIQLSYWNKERLLLDPFCGSGTIPIEAAMIGRNMAPGLNRNFISEEWEIIDKKFWNDARREAWDLMDQECKLDIIGLDIDRRTIARARANAESIMLEDDILFLTKDFREFDFKDKKDVYGVIVTNPPYGERLGEKEEVQELYRDLGDLSRDLPNYSVYTITSDEEFEKFYGKQADRKRKLYNGRIKVDYYQFYGPRPPRD